MGRFTILHANKANEAKNAKKAKRIFCFSALLVLLVLLASLAFVQADLLGPVQFPTGQHKGDGVAIEYQIRYLEPWGHTVADAGGLRYYHDRLAPGFVSYDAAQKLPSLYWGEYPLYYAGMTMRYQIILRNAGPRSYRNLRIVAIQEYLSPSGGWSERIGPDWGRDWFLEELRSGETVVWTGEIAIPLTGTRSGLDQTHIQVQHWNRGQGKPGPGSVLIDDAQAAIWCPPDFKP